jgi:glucan phosphoethanolaminetransferase (alkaline phosphatase superfamily)
LILVNKLGAHFPVHDKYPDAYMRFTPVVRRGDFTDISDTGDRAGFEGDWERYRNAYRNTLIWNVGEFFNIILAGADLEHSFLIYTSDHGQDFHEDGSPGLGLHCSSSPSPNEGLVPMVLITEHPKWAELAATWSRHNRNHTSHFNIFPTLLRVMGYDGDVVREVYGPSLFEPTNDTLSFISRFDRFGRAPRWTRVRLPVDAETPQHRLPHPPE